MLHIRSLSVHSHSTSWLVWSDPAWYRWTSGTNKATKSYARQRDRWKIKKGIHIWHLSFAVLTLNPIIKLIYLTACFSRIQFKKKLQSVAVDGTDIVAAANKAYQKSLAWLEAKDSKAKEAAQTEATRVAELKRIRGEKWLPSVARDMKAAGPIIKQTSKPLTRQ